MLRVPSINVFAEWRRDVIVQSKLEAQNALVDEVYIDWSCETIVKIQLVAIQQLLDLLSGEKKRTWKFQKVHFFDLRPFARNCARLHEIAPVVRTQNVTSIFTKTWVIASISTKAISKWVSSEFIA